ncbi:MAG: class I tRNA ligase family protein, partial [Acidimicrobiales bacterium]
LRAVTEPIDRAMLATLDTVVTQATAAFEAYDYARALERTEAFFWSFCDDYLELVKARAYGGPGVAPAASASARAALALALGVLQRLFAPFLPFVAEEVWSWWQDGSVHRARWPEAAELGAGAASDQGGDPLVLAVTAAVLGHIRRAKSEAHRSMRSPVARVVVTDAADRLSALGLSLADLRTAGTVVGDLELVEASEGSPSSVVVELADTDSGAGL